MHLLTNLIERWACKLKFFFLITIILSLVACKAKIRTIPETEGFIEKNIDNGLTNQENIYSLFSSVESDIQENQEVLSKLIRIYKESSNEQISLYSLCMYLHYQYKNGKAVKINIKKYQSNELNQLAEYYLNKGNLSKIEKGYLLFHHLPSNGKFSKEETKSLNLLD